MTGVTTNIVTSVEVTASEVSDFSQFAGLVESTAKRFEFAEVSADKGHLSKRNMELVNALGATPYIAFKAGTIANNGCEIWAKMYHTTSNSTGKSSWRTITSGLMSKARSRC